MPVTAQDLVNTAKSNITEIDSNTAMSQVNDLTIIDVREPNEFAEGHLPGAINVPRGVLEFKIGNQPAVADTNTDILIYCLSGGRGALATESLQKLGYRNVKNLAGGIKAWQEADGAIEK
ncbi:MAG TPA: rhodanese-like domain-containing protein [Crenotrichaceae bacterium]|nr:rhodanese-like domain-containing protein [Crenotrichaceae bacterium]